ncbi:MULTISPECIES: delta-60 repeat domain-containing protein [unclassified Pseudomonas]|uniref:delta-60 repeat domain-containing protein n=1 Tax=unclassified Pseudomonas TaxID=196821 RepID=UPI001CBE7816|nr:MULTISPECIES: delta-60 repeat domain-containing protein [unclassified Pseudomonas]
MSQYTALTARADGDLDPTFGDDKDGKKILRFLDARDTSGECIVEGPDGNIYVGGAVDADGDDIIHKLGIACLHKDGTPNVDFGNKGYVIVRFGPMQDTHLRQILFVTVGGETRILLSGIDTKKGEVVLARLHLDGRVDERFGVKGLLTVKLPANLSESLGLGSTPLTTTSSGASGPCTVAEGKIYVVMEMYMPIWIARVALLIRLNPDGSYDTGFNKSGYVAVTNQHWGNSTISDFLVRNGKITVCGTLAGHGMVARVNEDGSFDQIFADKGFKVFDNLGVAFEKLTPYSDKSVLVAGWGLTPRHGVLACLTENGEFESTFNNAKVLLQSLGEGVMFFGVGLVDGKIIASGRFWQEDNTPEFVVVRYLINGKLDTDFGRGKGWSSTRFENHSTVANTMTLQKDGQVLVLGDWGSGVSYAALIARFLNTTPSVAATA